MNIRERFLKTYNYEPVDRVPDFEFGYWDECFQVWQPGGLPQGISNNWDAERYFRFEYWKEVPASVTAYPAFKYNVLEIRGDHKIVQDRFGAICEESVSGRSIPKYLKFPIETREDWKRFRDERLNLETQGRIPQNIDEELAEHRNRDYPLGIVCGGLYGYLRNWMGVENLSIAIMEDRDWVEEMIEHLMQLSLSVLSMYMGKLDFDFGTWWEDMCFNSGPLVSPRFFNEIMVPRYRRITSLMAQHGIKHQILDCDGKIDELVPGWLEAGINVMLPVEAAHTDQAKLRQEYGKGLLFMGGVNKLALIQGKDAIDKELARVEKLLEDGGFIPHIDHRCPPDVTLENYRYYVSRKREIIGRKDVVCC